MIDLWFAWCVVLNQLGLAELVPVQPFEVRDGRAIGLAWGDLSLALKGEVIYPK
jgi:hypothetical protein